MIYFMQEVIKLITKTKRISYDHVSYEKPSVYAENFYLHCHSTYELLFFEKGEANYIIDEKKYKLHKNDLVFCVHQGLY